MLALGNGVGGDAGVPDSGAGAPPARDESRSPPAVAPAALPLPSPEPARPLPGAAPSELDENIPDRVCLDGLRERQIAFVEWPTKGIRTPVRILGPIGVVRLRMHDPRLANRPALMDCELARALFDTGPAFRAIGVRELLYSGAYQYRTRRGSSRLSEHAHGMAIDVHAFVLDTVGPDGGGGTVVEVSRDFEPRVGKWAVLPDATDCVGRPRTDVGRMLRTLACRLRASSVLREVITPDDNADHHDHFHLEAYPDGYTRARAMLWRKATVNDD